MLATAASVAASEGGGLHAQVAAAAGKPYGTDPDLQKVYKPGDLWPLTFDQKQLRAAESLADIILPADDLGPAASTLGVPDMVDEWISAPYDPQRNDRPLILEGLGLIDAEARKRYRKDFADLAEEEKTAICDAICDTSKVADDLKQAARFFARFRALCAGAYYATPEGWKAIGYVGNMATATFDGPPPEVLARLGVEQTVA